MSQTKNYIDDNTTAVLNQYLKSIDIKEIAKKNNCTTSYVNYVKNGQRFNPNILLELTEAAVKNQEIVKQALENIVNIKKGE